MPAAVAGEVLRDLSGMAAGSLIAAIWQGALLAGAAAVGLKLLPKTPAAARFAIWFGVFLVMAALPFAGVWAHGAHAGTSGVHPAWLTVDARWSEGVLLLWALASAVRAVMLGVGAVRVHSLWTRAVPVNLPGFETSAKVGGREIQVCTSDEIDRPSVIGFFSPKILIPAWLLEKLTPEELTHVILHEAGHLRRADDWLNLLQKMALVVFPLNPALAWVEKRLCFEREMACDEGVLKATRTPKAYASCLASLAEHRMTRRGMALMMGAVGRESELGQRVRRILSGRESMGPVHTRLVVGGAAVALLAGVAGLEQFPQVIGFSSSAAEIAGAAPVKSGVGYQNVSYRQFGAAAPVRAVETVVRTPIVSSGVSSRAMIPVRAASTKANHPAAITTVLRQVSAVARPVQRPQTVTARWVVMTSWSTDMPGYQGRVVMTSVQSGLMPAGRVESSGGGESRADAAPEQTPVEQIFPYAAVPVRGGWLVIQL